ncbi:VOC family protein [Marinobacterium rhizophilum]|uniref:VOC family protein n=1 Tax=Marinobacterium rhizophilum TaxID=420402 RepID=A0ABY5HLB7_9GAMM|nr:VOC family protein [Marinobacterium rhizophilum]UTW13183.1 VOC family protein [Marinobacterium rhizophilum]
MSVKAIPEGFHTATPYLAIKGASDAIEFYKKAFGATERFRLDMPDGGVGHAEILIGDSPIMLSDECGESHFHSPATLGGSSFGVHLYVEDVDARFAQAIAAGATELSPVKDQFYGDRLGSLKDPYGHVWFLSTHIEDLSEAQIAERAKAMFEREG